MHAVLLAIFKLLPVLTLIFSFIVFFIALILFSKPQSYIIFCFLTFELYANWIAVFLAPNYQNVLFDSLDNTRGSSGAYSINIERVWYCPKCHTNTSLSCHHCILCNKCIIQRNHHCFFLGACICLRNLCHFIIFCLYTSIVGLYVNAHLYLHLYQHFHYQEVGNPLIWHLGARYFFPVALGKWISGQEDLSYLMLVALFDMLVSVTIFTFGFGIYHLYVSVNGEVVARLSGRFYQNKRTSFWDNFHNVFGRWGLLNFIFPIVLIKYFCQKRSLQLESKYV